MEAKLRQEAELQWEAELRRTEVETMEEGEGSRTGVSEEEEAWYEDDNKDGVEMTTASGEDINIPNEDAERDNNVFDGDEDVDRDAVRGGGGSEADEWETGRIDGDKDEYLLEVEDMEEMTYEEEIDEEISE